MAGITALKTAKHKNKHCCERFAECVKERSIFHCSEDDETEWAVKDFYHLYFCPFCGSFIKGKGWGKNDKKYSLFAIEHTKTTKKFSKEGMNFFVFHAVPRIKTGLVQGAYVSCWINFRLYEGALALAKFFIKNEGWKVKTLDSSRWIKGQADAAPKTLRYYREAQRTGASFVFHSYRNDSK
jgi:hypothetical protein